MAVTLRQMDKKYRGVNRYIPKVEIALYIQCPAHGDRYNREVGCARSGPSGSNQEEKGLVFARGAESVRGDYLRPTDRE